jgi:hypothetical protein
VDCHDRQKPPLRRALLLGPHGFDERAHGLVRDAGEAGVLHRAGVLAIRQTRDGAGRGDVLAVCDRHDHGHSRARRQAGDVAAVGIDRELLFDRIQDPPQISRLAEAFMAMLLDEEAPAVLRARREERMAGDEREDDDEAFALGELGEAGLADHVLLALQAAVQDHDHRRGILAAEAVRHEDLIGSLARARVGARRQAARQEGAGLGAVGPRQKPEQKACGPK